MPSPGQDVTAYHQRIAKDQLKTLMEMEADRMTHLRLTADEVATERQVIIEERRSRVDNNPGARLDEQMNAALYLSHPYGVPVIGWAHEMATLSQEDAMRFYKRYYAPNNAILVVAGDVTPEEVKRLAEETYGSSLPIRKSTGARVRRSPPHVAARRVMLKDPRAGNASFHRYYVVPSYVTAKPGEAEALDLLMKILADGSTSRLYRKLVVEDKIAATTGGDYSGYSLDSGAVSLYAVAANGDLKAVEADVDQVLEEILKNGVTELELERAKKSLTADYIYDSDNQANLARRYGWAVAIGRQIGQVEGWPQAIAKVTPGGHQSAANAYLDARHSVTGWLLPSRTTARAPASKSSSQSCTHVPDPGIKEANDMVAVRSLRSGLNTACGLFGLTASGASGLTVPSSFGSALFSVLAIALLATLSSPANAMKIQTVKSPGGIEAWLVEEHAVPMMAMRFAFEGGSSQDPANKEGLANFVTAMLDEGAGDLSSRQFQERMEDLSMRMNYEEAKDAFYGNFETLTENRDEAAKLLKLALNKPRFDEDAVERIRQQLLASLAYAKRDPRQGGAERVVRRCLCRSSLRAACERHRGDRRKDDGARISRATASAYLPRTR
ncbi:MAG: insulinase family protein [Hyphomicrobium sp.]